MERLIQIQDQNEFINQLRLLIKDELNIILKTIQNTPKEEKLLTRDEVLKLLQISEATLWKRMNDGTLPFSKLGRRVYFKENDINNL